MTSGQFTPSASSNRKKNISSLNRSFEAKAMFIDDELGRISQDLETKESKKKGKGSLEMYMELIENISVILKHRHPKFGSILMRGVVGIKKALGALPVQFRNRKGKSLSSQDKNTQTQIIEASDPDSQIELEKFLSQFQQNVVERMITTCKKLGSSNLQHKLTELYRHLNRMRTDIPSETDLSSIEGLHGDHLVDKLQTDLQGMHRDMVAFLVRNKITKECMNQFVQTPAQMDLQHNIDQLTQQLKNKTEYITILEYKNKKYHAKYKNTQKDVSREQFKYKELEEKVNKLDFQTRVAEQKQAGRQQVENSAELRARLREYQDLYEKMKEKRGEYKVKIQEQQDRMRLQEKMLFQQEDELEQANLAWRMTEEKLNQITEAWEDTYGSPFTFREVDPEYLKQKYGIQKKDLKHLLSPKKKNIKQGDFQENIKGVFETQHHHHPRGSLGSDGTPAKEGYYGRSNQNPYHSSRNSQNPNDPQNPYQRRRAALVLDPIIQAQTEKK